MLNLSHERFAMYCDNRLSGIGPGYSPDELRRFDFVISSQHGQTLSPQNTSFSPQLYLRNLRDLFFGDLCLRIFNPNHFWSEIVRRTASYLGRHIDGRGLSNVVALLSQGPKYRAVDTALFCAIHHQASQEHRWQHWSVFAWHSEQFGRIAIKFNALRCRRKCHFGVEY